jgi:cell division protein FtsB
MLADKFVPVMALATWATVLLIILGVLLALFVVLLIVGNKMQKKQLQQKEQIEAMAQTMSMLVIDKKVMKFSEAKLPDEVMAQVPKLYRRAKMPFVKVKIGPRIMTLIADQKVFAAIPVKKEIKAVVSGMYITEIKSVRGGSIITPKTKKQLKEEAKAAKKAAKEAKKG